jgi:hypothetical protein
MNKNRQQAVKQASETHRVSLRKNLERRLAIARESGDTNLVRLLEAEADYLG